jgi:hypothetical protein
VPKRGPGHAWGACRGGARISAVHRARFRLLSRSLQAWGGRGVVAGGGWRAAGDAPFFSGLESGTWSCPVSRHWHVVQLPGPGRGAPSVLGAPPNMCHLFFVSGWSYCGGRTCVFLPPQQCSARCGVAVSARCDRHSDGPWCAACLLQLIAESVASGSFSSSADSSTSLACTCSPAFTSTFPTPFLPPSPNTVSLACSTVSGVERRLGVTEQDLVLALGRRS